MRLPAQLAPKRCACADSLLTMPGRSGPMTVTTSEVIMGCRSSVSETVRRIIATLVAKCSSCGRRQRAVLVCSAPRAEQASPIGASAAPTARAPIRRGDEAPVLRGDGAGVPAIGQVIDRAARDRIALEGPLHGGDAAMARQQRRVVADAAEPRLASASSLTRACVCAADDQFGAVGDLGARHVLRIVVDARPRCPRLCARAPADRRRRAQRRARSSHASLRNASNTVRRNSGNQPAYTSWSRIAPSRRRAVVAGRAIIRVARSSAAEGWRYPGPMAGH